MKKASVTWLCLSFWLALATAASTLSGKAERNWPRWRGPLATGVAPHGDPPITWSESENVRWKVEIPGRGHASPIVWEDQIFLLTAVQLEAPIPQDEQAAVKDAGEAVEKPAEKGSNAAPAAPPAARRRGPPRRLAPSAALRFEILSIDRGSGEIRWRRTAREAVPHEGTHLDATWASASAVTDGERVYASFGSHGLYAYDLEGKLLWQHDFGDMTTRNGFGEGASPVVAGKALVINWDHEGESFIVAVDKKTGRELWRAERDEPTSWSTPITVEHEGRTQVIVNATNRIRAYDAKTGRVVWESGGMTLNTIPSPMHQGGLVYAMSGFRGNALLAIRLAGAEGDVTGSEAIVWSYDRDTPYVPSPLLDGNDLYFLKRNGGILTNLDARTGEVRFGPERLPRIDGVYASLVGAADRVYVAGRDGTTLVLRRGLELEVLATNTLDDSFDASPAIVGRELFLRGGKYLYCIAEEPEESAEPEPASPSSDE